jgi:invasion protein IalB
MPLTLRRSGLLEALLRAAVVSSIVAFSAFSASAQDAPAADAPVLEVPTPEAPAAATEVEQPGWEKVCGVVNEAQECHISRRRLAATGQAIAQFMIIERADKKLVQIAVPPVALIQPGIQLRIDDAEPMGVKYVVCTPGECLALGEINNEVIAALKGGGELIITMLNPQGQQVNFDISLAGFTASYDGPGIDPAQAEAQQQQLEEELRRRADAARQQLLDAQQQSSTQ